MSSDTWSDIQAHKNRQSNLREKLARRKKERQEKLIGTGSTPTPSVSPAAGSAAQSGAPLSAASTASPLGLDTKPVIKGTPPGTTALISPPRGTEHGGLSTKIPSPNLSVSPNRKTSENVPAVKQEVPALTSDMLQDVEKRLLLLLSDVTLTLPIEVSSLISSIKKQMNTDIPHSAVEDLLHKFSAQMLINLENKIDEKTGGTALTVESVDHNKVDAVTNEMEGMENFSKKRKKDSEEEGEKSAKQSKTENDDEDLIENLLSMESAKQRESKKMSDEILQLLSKPTAKEMSLIEKFKSQGGAQVKEFCPNGTREECTRVSIAGEPCVKLHFRKIINKHTDESLGDCSFLNTCFHMDTCKYVHYEIDYPRIIPRAKSDSLATSKKSAQEGSTILFPPQWVQCDLRTFDMTVLGKFAVVMADPPWDIHMELPYGTMSDDEMRKLQVPVLQDDGYIFLWVTGRAMELGRECLQLWGYERVDELIWVKTNQLQRIIRTGRTGHWLNHGKEHCLIGVKGNPKSMNRGLDCDVIVAEVRATSHKPDEIYGIIERLSPGTRKIELFGRPHNVQPNWFTLGNQVDGVKLNEPDVVKAYKQRYPDGNCMKP